MSRNISRRSFLRLAAGSAAALLAAACQPTQVPSPGPAVQDEVPAPVAPAPTDYTGKFVIMSASAVEHFVPMVEEIEADYPGVEVDWRNLSSERYTELFAASEVAGDQIDILHMNGQDLRRYATADRLTDLSDLDYLDRFRPVSTETYTLMGKLWALPLGDIAPWTLFFNKKAFEAIGVTEEISTYTELQEMAPALRDAGYEIMAHEGQVLYMWPVWHFIMHAQASGNQSIENTVATLRGETKFTEDSYIEALRLLERYSRDGMFMEGVLATDRDGAQRALEMGQTAMWHNWPGIIRGYREAQERGELQDLELSVMPTLQVVEGAKRELPGGVGAATGIYRNIDASRRDLAYDILDKMTSDKWVGHINRIGNAAVSSNVNVEPSDDPLAIKYAQDCAPLTIVYEDWLWPPEITRSFQENLQAIVAGTVTPEQAAQMNQNALDELYAEGYEFVD